MLSLGTTISTLPSPNWLGRQKSLVFPGEQDIALAALGEGDGRSSRASVEDRHMLVQLTHEGLRLRIVAAIGLAGIGPGRDEVPAATARCLRIRSDN